MKKKIFISFYNTESFVVDDAIQNFIYSKAYKYLEYYSQGNSRYYDLLKDKIKIDSDDVNDFFVKSVDCKGYSQSERQEFNFYFNKDIQKDSEAMEELKYFLQDLKYYFTAYAINITGYIENVKNIDGNKYIYKENLESLHFELYEDEIKDEYMQEFLAENGIDGEKFELVYDTKNIIY